MTDNLEVKVGVDDASLNAAIKKLDLVAIKWNLPEQKNPGAGVALLQKAVDKLLLPLQTLQVKSTLGTGSGAGGGLGAGDIVEAITGSIGGLITILGPLIGVAFVVKSVLSVVQPILSYISVMMSILILPFAAFFQSIIKPVFYYLLKFLMPLVSGGKSSPGANAANPDAGHVKASGPQASGAAGGGNAPGATATGGASGAAGGGNLSTMVNNFSTQVGNVTTQLGDSLGGLAKGVAGVIDGFIPGFSKSFATGLDTLGSTWGTLSALFMAVVNNVISGFGSIWTAFQYLLHGNLVGFITSLGAAFLSFVKAGYNAMLGLIAISLSVLGPIGIYIFTGLQTLANGIFDFLAGIGGYFWDGFLWIITLIQEAMAVGGTYIWGVFTGIIDDIVKALAPFGLNLLGQLESAVATAISNALGGLPGGKPSEGKTVPVKDAVIDPSGNVVSTDPNDWLFATKNPGALGKGIGSGGGDTYNITVHVNNPVVSSAQQSNQMANTVAQVMGQNLKRGGIHSARR